MQSRREEVIRNRIRQMLDSGAIACDEAEKVWAGRGSGSHCAACAEPISTTEIEFEVELGAIAPTVLRLHRDCHEIWQDECGEQRASAPAPP
jgi:hypothetical protein